MRNSFSAVHPELISEWSEKNLPLTPDQITFGSNKEVWWKGTCGHEWRTSTKARSRGEKCPVCSGARVVEGINDLSTMSPALASEWSKKNKQKPTEVSPGSHKKAIWQCKRGHEWKASIKSRAVNRTGCPYCSHNKVLAGFNDLATQFPKIAAEWSERNLPLTPDMVTAFTNQKVWWKCREGHEWYTLISTRSGGSKCPYCSGIKLLKGFNDFATRYPDLATEWSERNLPLTPEMINEKSKKTVWWQCRQCGYEWKSAAASRAKGARCPVCAQRKVLAGYNDLATTNKEILKEWDYEKNTTISPEGVSAGSQKSVWWKCKCGHSWKCKIRERVFEQRECSVCNGEFQSVFPQLTIKYYADQHGLTTKFDTDEIIGIPLDIYIPEEKVAVSIRKDSEPVRQVKKHLCRQRGIRYMELPYNGRRLEVNYIHVILKMFQMMHIFISTDIDNDMDLIKKKFMEWRVNHKT